MSGPRREDSLVMWAIMIILIGTTIILATHSVYRGVQVDNLEAELKEVKLMMFKLQQKEDSVEIELTRAKRQVDLASRPEVLDYAYNAKLPESTANLSVYDRWFTKPSVDSGGISNYHKVSAAWVGEDGEEQGNPEEWNDLFAKQNDQQYTHQFGVGEAFHSGESLNQYQNTHRRSRVASTGGQGTLLEIPGHLGGGGGGGNNLRNFNVIPKSQIKTTTAHTTTQTTPPPPPSPRPTYKRPQLKSLGTPDKPTTSSTAVQLEAGPGHAGGVHSHWRLARWARRLGVDTSFPLSGGKVGVPSPGLYLVYAQVAYVGKFKHQGFSVIVNDNNALECQEHRGMAMEMMCHTVGLLYLEQGDRVSIKDIHGKRKIDTGAGKTFFGLVKLTADWI